MQNSLTVVIAAQGASELAERCIQSLQESLQACIEPPELELIVCEGPPYAAIELIAKKWTSVRCLRAQSLGIPSLHGLGVDSARGELIAITESHCTFRTDWVAAVMRSHGARMAEIIGGCVSPGCELNLLNRGLFLCDYAQFLPPKRECNSADLPGNNVVFKRAILPLDRDFRQHGFWKTFLCHEFADKGYELILDPRMHVYYNRELTFVELVRRRLNHGRCFGGMRAAKSDVRRRCLYFIAGPLLPFLLTCKVYRRCADNGDSRRLFLRAWPAVVLCQILWSLGEWFGNLSGAGDSCSKL